MSEKLENILNLALETPEQVREQTENLNVGFDSENRTWELIVKYHGSLRALEEMGVGVEYLIAGYAVLTVPENLVEGVAEINEVEYVEKPKRYFYSAVAPSESACLAQVTLQEPFLTGRGVLMAVLDSGIEFGRADFRKANGDTRILYLWDQTLKPSEEEGRMPPEGFSLGVEFNREQIDRALRENEEGAGYRLLPSRDVSGHGTAVAGIAAGSSTEGGVHKGVAPEAGLLIVKLGIPGELGFPRTTEIMRGVTYALRRADELGMPLVINLSFGNSYGPHDGSSLFERFLDNAAEIGRTVICVGSGNEGSSRGHIAGNVRENTAVEFSVGEYETSLNVQIWKQYSDEYRIRLRSPGGQVQELSEAVEQGKYTFQAEQTRVLAYLGEPTPYRVAQEIYLDMIPASGPYINSGVWTILIEPVRIVTGQYYLYLPGSAVRNENTGFYRATPQVTLTAPSSAAKVITVGAYDSTYDTYADFSGRGYADEQRSVGVVMAGLVKPDLAAPGVGVVAPDIYGGYRPFTGTSFATPIVSGSAALLMEWGIVRGNDSFLYGEKVKAYLRAGARPLRGEPQIPNDRVGFGALCVADSLPL